MAPLYNSSLRIERILSKTTNNLIHCELPDGSIAAFPSWMMNPEICAQFSKATPQLSLDALGIFHSFLSEILTKNSATFEPHLKKQEVSKNEETKSKSSNTIKSTFYKKCEKGNIG